MLKKEELRALPRTPKPTRALEKEAAAAKAHTTPGVLCTRVHDTAQGPVLAVDLWARDVLQAREFFDGHHRRVFLADGMTTTKGLFKAAHCHTLVWSSAAAGKRVEEFFHVPQGRTESAEELLCLVEHGKRLPDGTFTASGAGDAGGHHPAELTAPLPEGWQAAAVAQGMAAPHVLLLQLAWVRDPLTGKKERMDKCTCSACGVSWYENRGIYDNDQPTVCPECGAQCTARRGRRGKWLFESTGSLLWFHRHQDTAVAQGYEIGYWVDNEAKENWQAIHANLYAWGPYGNYAFNCYYTWGLGHQREYLDTWYAQSRMVDNWAHGRCTVLLAPEEGALAGTPLENARLRAYALAKQRWLYPVRLATMSRRLPVLEGFCDFEDWDTVFAICGGNIKLKNGETKPHRALGLSRPEYDRYRAEKWNWSWLPAYRAAKESGWTPGRDELMELMRALQYTDRLQEIERLAPGRLGQVWSYIKRTVRREFAKQEKTGCGRATMTRVGALRKTLDTWLDYRKMAAELEIDTAKRDAAMPYDLFQRHDRLVEEKHKRKAEEQIKKEAAKAGKFTAMWEKIRWADWQDGPYLIRAAKSTAELVAEGNALHHCVGSYTDNVLAGRVIFFIRRVEEPDKPWYTLNLDIKTGELLQLHGYGNNERENDPAFAEVKAWAEKWRTEIWMPGKKNRKKQEKAA